MPDTLGNITKQAARKVPKDRQAYVSHSAIAKATGVVRGTLNADPTFPEPDIMTVSGLNKAHYSWKAETIEEWARQTGRELSWEVLTNPDAPPVRAVRQRR